MRAFLLPYSVCFAPKYVMFPGRKERQIRCATARHVRNVSYSPRGHLFYCPRRPSNSYGGQCNMAKSTVLTLESGLFWGNVEVCQLDFVFEITSSVGVSYLGFLSVPTISGDSLQSSLCQFCRGPFTLNQLLRAVLKTVCKSNKSWYCI